MKDDTLLARWLDGSLSEKELMELQNSPEYATLLRMKHQFAQLQSPSTDENRILKNILNHKKGVSTKVIPFYRKTWFAAAAMAILLLGLSVFFTLPKKFSSANGETYAFALPDASEVILNAGSAASYRSWNWSGNRNIALQGEAYFKVAKGKKFTVETTMGSVSVLGTQFNVRARNGRFDVVCYEGKVQVRYNGKEIVLLPKQKITVVDGISKGLAITKNNQPEWMQQELLFENETFANVLSELERNYAVTLTTTLQSKQLFTGIIPRNDLEAALKIIGLTYHLKIEKSGQHIVLIPFP